MKMKKIPYHVLALIILASGAFAGCETRNLVLDCANIYDNATCEDAYMSYSGQYWECHYLAEATCAGTDVCFVSSTTTSVTGLTTTSTGFYSLPDENYGTLPSMNGSGGILPGTGISNTTGLGESIIGFKTDMLLQWFAIFLALGLLMLPPYKLGVSLSAFCVLFFTLMVQWSVFTGSVCLIICFLAGYEWVREYYS
jgi:hypothetical protein